MFDRVQRIQAQFLLCRFLFVAALPVPLRGARIKVPAVEVDTLTFLLQFCKQRMNLGQRFGLQDA